MLTVESGIFLAGSQTPRCGNSVSESCLSGDSAGSTGGRRRRSSVALRRGSLSALAASPRAPVYLLEVASRIVDAAEGTILDWPYDQEPVDRFTNPLLTVDEMKQRYGNRRQPFGPEHDISSSGGSHVRAHRKGHKQVAPDSPSRIPNSTVISFEETGAVSLRRRPQGMHREAITSNAQLLSSVRAAKKELRVRLREETSCKRLQTMIRQWRDRVVDFAPSGVLKKDTKLQYNPLLDPVHLHQECMQDILVEEGKVAEELFAIFQKLAREGDEMRKLRQKEEEDALPFLSEGQQGGGLRIVMNAPNPIRQVEPRVPFHHRMGCGAEQSESSRNKVPRLALGDSIADIDPERDGQGLLPQLPQAVVLHSVPPTLQITQRKPAPPQKHGRAVEEIIHDAAPPSVRKAPWPIEPLLSAPANDTMEVDGSLQINAAKVARTSPLRSLRVRDDVQQMKYVPSSSSSVDAAVRSMVAAYNAMVDNEKRGDASPGKRRSSKFKHVNDPSAAGVSEEDAQQLPLGKKGSRTRSIVTIAAEELGRSSSHYHMTHPHESPSEGDEELRAPSPAELPDYWPDVHIPSDPALRAVFHERLTNDAMQPCPDTLMCPISSQVMSEPIVICDATSGSFSKSSSDATVARVAGAVSVDRTSWEFVLDGLHDGTLSSSKLPSPLHDLLSRCPTSRLTVRMDTEKLVLLITWRSTAMWHLSNRVLDRREAFHISTSLVNDLVESATQDDLAQSLLHTAKASPHPPNSTPQSDASPSPRKRGAVTTKCVVEKRRRYPVNMVALRGAALDAARKIRKIIPLLEGVRGSGQRVLRSLETLQVKRGCYERDILRLYVRLAGHDNGAPSPPREVVDNAEQELRSCDEELNLQGKMLLDLERRYSSLRALWSSLSDRVDTFNEHVNPFNRYSATQKAYWGPIYKATVSACHTVVSSLIDREMQSTFENRPLMQKVAECLEEESVTSMMSKLPALLVRLQTRMRQAKLLTSPLLPLDDAAFVIMSPLAQLEDITTAEPLLEISYPSLRGCPPFAEAPNSSAVAQGMAMLKRKSLVPLPASPRGVRQEARAPRPKEAPNASDIAPQIVRTAGSDMRIPFWHFVRKPGSPSAKVEVSSTSGEEAGVAAGTTSARIGLRGNNAITPVSAVRMENDRASLFVVAPGQRFLAHEPKHATARRPRP